MTVHTQRSQMLRALFKTKSQRVPEPQTAISNEYRRAYNSSGVPTNFVRAEGGSTNSVEDRGQREWGSGGR